MSFVILLLAKISICVTILVYSSLIGENTLLAKTFTRPVVAYQGQHVWYIAKTTFCSLVAIGYNLNLSIPDNLTVKEGFEILMVQLLLGIFGFSFLKQSIMRTVVVGQMKKKLIQLKLVDTQHSNERRTAVKVSASSAH